MRRTFAFFDVVDEPDAAEAALKMEEWLRETLPALTPVDGASQILEVQPAHPGDTVKPTVLLGFLVVATIAFADSETPPGDAPHWLAQGLNVTHEKFRFLEVSLPGNDHSVISSDEE